MASVQPVEIKIFGNDQKQLQKLSGEVSALVGKVDGTADIFNGIVIAGPSVNVKPNYNTLAQYDITPMLLPVVLVCMILLVNNKKIMDKYVNGTMNNIIGWSAVIILIVLTLALLFLSFF